MSKRVWNIRYVVGNPKMFSRVTTDASSPMRRGLAMEGYDTIARLGWAVWVEHVATGERIAESAAEKQRQAEKEK